MLNNPIEKHQHRATAEAWTAHQAARLEISAEAIMTAITRGWTPDLIDAVDTAAELLLEPKRDVFGLKVVRGG
jgi:hypothetical protein